MNCRRLVVHGLVLLALLTACATRPAVTQVPPPSGEGGPSVVRPAVSKFPDRDATTSRSAAQSRSIRSPERPAPKDFVAIDELRDIHFDFDRYEIRAADIAILEANAAWLRANATYLVLIEGHCDPRGTGQYNLALGERRAKAAMDYLVSRGVGAGRMTIVSFGEERAQCTDPTESCWAQNRRAQFLVKPE